MSRKSAKKAKNAEKSPNMGAVATRFGDVAEALGLVTADDIIAALKRQERRDADSKAVRIGDILVEQGKLSEQTVEHVLAEQKEVADAKLATAKSGIDTKYDEFAKSLAEETKVLKESLTSRMPLFKESLKAKISSI